MKNTTINVYVFLFLVTGFAGQQRAVLKILVLLWLVCLHQDDQFTGMYGYAPASNQTILISGHRARGSWMGPSKPKTRFYC